MLECKNSSSGFSLVSFEDQWKLATWESDSDCVCMIDHVYIKWIRFDALLAKVL